MQNYQDGGEVQEFFTNAWNKSRAGGGKGWLFPQYSGPSAQTKYNDAQQIKMDQLMMQKMAFEEEQLQNTREAERYYDQRSMDIALKKEELRARSGQNAERGYQGGGYVQPGPTLEAEKKLGQRTPYMAPDTSPGLPSFRDYLVSDEGIDLRNKMAHDTPSWAGKNYYSLLEREAMSKMTGAELQKKRWTEAAQADKDFFEMNKYMREHGAPPRGEPSEGGDYHQRRFRKGNYLTGEVRNIPDTGLVKAGIRYVEPGDPNYTPDDPQPDINWKQAGNVEQAFDPLGRRQPGFQSGGTVPLQDPNQVDRGRAPDLGKGSWIDRQSEAKQWELHHQMYPETENEPGTPFHLSDEWSAQRKKDDAYLESFGKEWTDEKIKAWGDLNRLRYDQNRNEFLENHPDRYFKFGEYGDRFRQEQEAYGKRDLKQEALMIEGKMNYQNPLKIRRASSDMKAPQPVPGYYQGGYVPSSDVEGFNPRPPMNPNIRPTLMGGNTDTVDARLTPGETVLTQEQGNKIASMLGTSPERMYGAAGVPGYSGGGNRDLPMLRSDNPDIQSRLDTGRARQVERMNEFAEYDRIRQMYNQGNQAGNFGRQPQSQVSRMAR